MTGPESARDDAAAIAAQVERAYAALDFPPGAEPDWAGFTSVFHPSAVLALRVFPEDPDVSVLNLREYALAQMRHDLADQGYSETPGASTVDVVGHVAVLRQDFTMNFADRSVHAVDVFSLARLHGTWLVVAVVSDLRDDGP